MSLKVEIRNLEKEFEKINNEALNKIEEKLAEKVELLLHNLKAATPVDTGRARASWVIVRNLERQNKKEKIFTIMNNVPYIENLNNGSSKQAPRHFIEKVALESGGSPVGTIVQVTES